MQTFIDALLVPVPPSHLSKELKKSRTISQYLPPTDKIFEDSNGVLKKINLLTQWDGLQEAGTLDATYGHSISTSCLHDSI